MSRENITVYRDDVTGRTTQDESHLGEFVITLAPAKGTKAERAAATETFSVDLLSATREALVSAFGGETDALYNLIRPVSLTSGHGARGNGNGKAVRKWAAVRFTATGDVKYKLGERGRIPAEVQAEFDAEQTTNTTHNGATGETTPGSPAK